MGAKFSIFLVISASAIEVGPATHCGERFFLVRNGRVRLTEGNANYDLEPGGFAFVPAGQDHGINAGAGVELVVMERPHIARPAGSPEGYVSSIDDAPHTTMKRDERLMVQKLLPQNFAFDMEINVLDFAPGIGVESAVVATCTYFMPRLAKSRIWSAEPLSSAHARVLLLTLTIN